MISRFRDFFLLLFSFSVSLCLCGLSSVAAAPPDFWPHWSDGKAEMNGYRLVQPRYGAKRAGTAVLIYVTEDFSDSLRVKADPGKHPASDVYPVLKLNAVRDFQTGIYDYNVMTSTFARVAPGWPIAKVSFSSQEWCGNIYHQLIPRAGRIDGILHSYFDGEADGRDDLPMPDGGVMEDAVPILIRGWMGEWLSRGETRTVPFLPSLLRSRLQHRRLAWGQATVARAKAPSRVTVPAGPTTVTDLLPSRTLDGRRRGGGIAFGIGPPPLLGVERSGRGEVAEEPGACVKIVSLGASRFRRDNDPERRRPSVLPARKSGGKTQLPTITWLWLPN